MGFWVKTLIANQLLDNQVISPLKSIGEPWLIEGMLPPGYGLITRVPIIKIFLTTTVINKNSDTCWGFRDSDLGFLEAVGGDVKWTWRRELDLRLLASQHPLALQAARLIRLSGCRHGIFQNTEHRSNWVTRSFFSAGRGTSRTRGVCAI